MTFTIALHGDGGTGTMLSNDMGNPDWVDRFPNYHPDSLVVVENLIIDRGPVNLIGFSRGGSEIAKLTTNPNILPHIKSAVLYESPVRDSSYVGGTFPVLMIWNTKGALLHRTRTAIESMRLWQLNHNVTLLIGQGRHIQTNPLGHDWDESLNPIIKAWLAKQ